MTLEFKWMIKRKQCLYITKPKDLTDLDHDKNRRKAFLEVNQLSKKEDTTEVSLLQLLTGWITAPLYIVGF